MQANLRALMATAENEDDQMALQSRISQLNILERTLVSVETLEELDELKHKIELVMATPQTADLPH